MKVLPGGQLLSTGTETTITVTDDLAFQVAVEDTGDSQEVQIKVTLTIPAQPDPIVRTATIPLIDPGETKTVTFTAKRGVHPYYCTNFCSALHQEMQGYMTVRPR